MISVVTGLTRYVWHIVRRISWSVLDCQASGINNNEDEGGQSGVMAQQKARSVTLPELYNRKQDFTQWLRQSVTVAADYVCGDDDNLQWLRLRLKVHALMAN